MLAKTEVINTRAETITIVAIIFALLLVCLALPLAIRYTGVDFLARNDQWIMGTVVNCALAVAVVSIASYKKVIALVFLPSIVHVINFYAFGIGTIFSLYMLPAIWLGNISLVLVFKYLYVDRNKKRINNTFNSGNFLITATIAVVVKAAIIFGIFSVLVAIETIPPMPATMMTPRMGVNQLIVGAVGCLIAFVILRSISRSSRPNNLSINPRYEK